jgi:hypothetical protein
VKTTEAKPVQLGESSHAVTLAEMSRLCTVPAGQETRTLWPVFSVCCLVTSVQQYAHLREQLSQQGFTDELCEFLACDNSEANRFSAYDGIRLFLREAKGRYVLILHQDAIPLESAAKLLAGIAAVENHDPLWGVIGNAGRTDGSRSVLSIVSGEDVYRPDSAFVRVTTIDENMMLIRNGTGITLSADVGGYHFYAFDLCSVAARLGYHSYVVDHLWRHDSHGTVDDDFLVAKQRMEEKMRAYHQGALVPTTCTSLCWSPSPFQKARARALSILTISNEKHRGIRRKMWLEGLFTNPLFLFYIVYYRFRDAWYWGKRGLDSRGRGAGRAEPERSVDGP